MLELLFAATLLSTFAWLELQDDEQETVSVLMWAEVTASLLWSVWFYDLLSGIDTLVVPLDSTIYTSSLQLDYLLFDYFYFTYLRIVSVFAHGVDMFWLVSALS